MTSQLVKNKKLRHKTKSSGVIVVELIVVELFLDRERERSLYTSRLVILGIGDGVGAILFAQVVRTSTVEERTAVLSLAMGARQIGGIVGTKTIVD